MKTIELTDEEVGFLEECLTPKYKVLTELTDEEPDNCYFKRCLRLSKSILEKL